MLSSDIHRRGERRNLPSNAGNVHNPLGVAGTRFARFGVRWRVQPAGDGDLSRADGMREVDV